MTQANDLHEQIKEQNKISDYNTDSENGSTGKQFVENGISPSSSVELEAGSVTDEELQLPEEEEFLDGGWGWLIIFACWGLFVITDGLRYSIGIIYLEILDRYQVSNAEASWIISLLNVFFYSSPLVSTGIMSRFGARAVVILGTVFMTSGMASSAFAQNLFALKISMGVLTGIGLGLIYQPGACLLGQFFCKRRGLANGIATCGTGIGLIAFPPLTNFLLNEFAYFGTCLILSAILLNGLVFAFLIIPVEEAMRIRQHKVSTLNRRISTGSNESKLKAATKPKSSSLQVTLTSALKSSVDFRLLKTPNFTIFALGKILLHHVYFLPFVYIPYRAKHYGIPEKERSYLLSIIGIGNFVSRIFFGFIIDLKYFRSKRLLWFLGSHIALGLCTVYSFGPTFVAQVIYSALYGVGMGAIFCLQCTTLADLIGVNKLPLAFGMVNFFVSVPSLTGPLIAGWLFSKTNYSFPAVFAFGGSGLVLSGLMLLCIPLSSGCKQSPVKKVEAKPSTPVSACHNYTSTPVSACHNYTNNAYDMEVTS